MLSIQRQRCPGFHGKPEKRGSRWEGRLELVDPLFRRAGAIRIALAGVALAGLLLGLAWLMPQAEAQPFPLAPPPAAPSNCNYNINNNAVFLWEDIDPAVGGAGTPLAHGDYTAFTVTPSPWFQFYFCGTYYPAYTFVSKGFMCFEGAMQSSQRCTPCCPYTPGSSAPSASIGRPAIFPYYSDLIPGNCQGGTPPVDCVWWQVVGTAPNRRLIYEFKNVPYYNDPYPGPLSFEIKLFEGSGCFEVHYLQTASYTYQTLSGYQNAAGTAGWTHEWQANGFTTAGTAWSACPAAPPPPPPPICMPLTQTVLVGQPAALSAGSGTPAYTWSAPGGSPSSGAGAAFTATYAAVGTYTVTVTDSNGQSAQCRVVVTPPPCGYTFTTSIPFNFVDISTTGTNLGHGLDTQIDVSMSWQAWLCDRYQTVLRTSSNGYVCPPTTACTQYIPHTSLPSTAQPNGAIFGYWTDLFVGNCNAVNPGTNCGTRWQVMGTAPDRVFIYSFKNVPFWSTGSSNTFQFKLFERTHCWEVHYDRVTGQSTQRTVAGLENTGGTVGWEWRNTPRPGFASTGEAWRTCPGTPPPPPPPVCAPATQNVPVGTPATLTASWGVAPYGWSAPGGTPSSGGGSSFTTTYTAPGTYTVTLLGSNDASTTCTVVATVPNCGYDVESEATYDFVDLTTTGAATGVRMLDDTISTVGLPFPFKFCGTTYTSVRLSSNGYVCLGTSSPVSCADFSPLGIPSAFNPRPAVYGYYSDLYATFCSSTTATSCTSWQVLGSAPNRVFVYMEKDVGYCCSASPNPVSVEIKLFEGTNCFEVHYKAVSDPGGGHRVVAGFQDAAGSSGYSYADSMPGFTRVARAWSACPPGLRLMLNEDQPPKAFDVVAQAGTGSQSNTTSWTQPAKGTLVRTPGGGTFTYQPLPDAVGSDSFGYTITSTVNGAILATGKVGITIKPVNDAPSFTAASEAIVVQPERRTNVIPGWGSLVRPASPSAVDEAGQGITFAVTNSDPSLFDGPVEVQRSAAADDEVPSVPTTGAFAILRFTPAGGATGAARVCARPVDTGGTATVTNMDGATATGVDTGPERCVDIIVNAPPVAAFRPSTTHAAPGEAVAFDDCPAPAPDCTYDPDGAIALWLWEFGDGATSGVSDPTHRYQRPGTYVVRLTVWDAYGSSATATRTITVEGHGTLEPADGAGGSTTPPPLADAGGNRTVVEGSRVTLTGTQRGGGQGTTFQWTQVGGSPVALDGADSATPSFTAPLLAGMEPATLAFGLRVADGAATSASDYAVVTVVSKNRAPVAAAGGLVEAVAGDAVTVDGTASSDPDGDALTYRWEQLAVAGEPMVAIADATAPKLTFTAPTGRTSLHFRFTVSDGKATSEDQVTVLVVPAAAPAHGAMARPAPADVALAEARVGPGQDLTWFVAGGAALVLVAAVVALAVVRRLR